MSLGRDDDPLEPDLALIAARVGVRRIADLSRLDELAIHVAAAIRTPLDPASISVCAGRGATWPAARRAAVAEAFERYCAEPRDRFPTVVATEAPGPAVTIASLVPSRVRPADEPIEWIAGTGVIDGQVAWVPAAAVFYPYRGATWFEPATHGLAAAPTWDAAVRAGLLECIERDAYTRAIALASLDRGGACPPLAADLLAPEGRRWHDAAVANGLCVLLRDLTAGTGIPTILATVADGEGSELWAHRGSAAALDARAAATSALGEALQGRLVDIQGAREDLPFEREAPARWFHRHDGEAVTHGPPSIDAGASTAELARRLVRDGCGEPIAVDLSLPDTAWRVVRIVVPGLETWAFDPSRVGARLEAWCSAS